MWHCSGNCWSCRDTTHTQGVFISDAALKERQRDEAAAAAAAASAGEKRRVLGHVVLGDAPPNTASGAAAVHLPARALRSMVVTMQAANAAAADVSPIAGVDTPPDKGRDGLGAPEKDGFTVARVALVVAVITAIGVSLLWRARRWHTRGPARDASGQSAAAARTRASA